MKNKHLIMIVLLLFVANLSHAQNYSCLCTVQDFTYSTVDNAIVRHWSGDDMAVCITLSKGRYFGVVSATNFTAGGTPMVYSGRMFSFTDSLEVLDFQVVDDYVFFCGIWNGSESAYGKFDLNKVADPIIKMDTYHSTYYGQGLRKMVAYKFDTLYRMVAIGTHTAPVPWDIVVEVIDMKNDGEGPLFAFSTTQSATQREHFDDIILVEDRVVIVGRDTRFGMNDISIRVAPINPVLNYPLLNCIEREYHLLVDEGPLLGRVKAAYVGDTGGGPAFALACTYLDADTAHVKIYRVSLLDTVPVVTSARNMAMDYNSELKEAIGWPHHTMNFMFLYGQTAGAQQLVLIDPTSFLAFTVQPTLQMFSISTADEAFAVWHANNLLLQRQIGLQIGQFCLPPQVREVPPTTFNSITSRHMPLFYHGCWAYTSSHYPNPLNKTMIDKCQK